MMKRIAINGFGRIGRAALKIIMDTENLEIAAINDLMSLQDASYLLRYDSVYGRYHKKVEAEGDQLLVGEHRIEYSSISDPLQLPWGSHEIDIVIESTGVFTDKEDAKKHLHAGASNVVISAPSKSKDVATVINGVNSTEGNGEIISCASCTTNNITPVMEILGRQIGIKKAILNTIHASTNSQSLLDSPSEKDPRRGRTAGINLVPTTTGAANAAIRAMPDYKDRFDGIAIRTPIPVGCISDITFIAERNTTVGEVNSIFEEESDSGRYEKVISVNNDKIVSTDIIQSPFAAIIDLAMTKVVDGDLVKILAWYDNEWGFVNQMIRQIKKMKTA